MQNVAQAVEGVYLHNLNPGSVLLVDTRNRHYRIEYLGGDDIKISGHPMLCPDPVPAELCGSVGIGGRFHGFLGRGMRMEFNLTDDHIPLITSVVEQIRRG